MSDDMKRLQIRDFLAGCTDSERLRIIEGFVFGMFGPPDPPKVKAAAASSEGIIAASTLVTQAELETLLRDNRIMPLPRIFRK